ncbi:MAG: hypothetical protein V7K26_00140 [Nostoc sp.]|uniref:hypothetical protein n=2 Tax=Nostoc sp. TaxID=1180 RepID=UPI002FF31D02
MSEDLLMDLCEPYLLDLIGLLVEYMRKDDDEDLAEIAKNHGYNIPKDVIFRIQGLDHLQKAEVLAIAANHIKTIAQHDREI